MEDNPVNLIDRFGLWVKRCSRLLGRKDRPAAEPDAVLRHEYLNVSGTILSFTTEGNPLWSQGKVDRIEDPNKGCRLICDDDRFDAYVFAAAQQVGAPTYCILAFKGSPMYERGARNCQSWTDEVLSIARRNYLANVPCPKC